MSASPIVYQYQHNNVDYDVSFLFKKKCHMINATEMTKIFGKRINDYIRQESTQEYVQAISDDTGIPVSEVYQIVRGGNPHAQGTWMHEDLALDFAQWLSPPFKLWCNRKLKELLRNGFVYLKTTEFNSLHEHMFAQVQRNNSKAIGAKNYGIEKDRNKIIKYFREMFDAYVGMTPSSLVAWAKREGIPLSITNKGGREVLRYVSPEKASVISFIDNCIASNPNLTMEDMYNLIKIGKRLEPEFQELCNMGIGDYKDLKYLNKMNEIKMLN